MAVKFVYGSQTQYDHQVLHNRIIKDALYFIYDTQRIYRGKELITRTPIKVYKDSLPEKLEPNTVYVVSEKDIDSGETLHTVYISDESGSAAAKITDNSGDIDPDKAFSKLAKLTSEDVKNGVLASAGDDKFVTGGALREAVSWNAI